MKIYINSRLTNVYIKNLVQMYIKSALKFMMFLNCMAFLSLSRFCQISCQQWFLKNLRSEFKSAKLIFSFFDDNNAREKNVGLLGHFKPFLVIFSNFRFFSFFKY